MELRWCRNTPDLALFTMTKGSVHEQKRIPILLIEKWRNWRRIVLEWIPERRWLWTMRSSAMNNDQSLQTLLGHESWYLTKIGERNRYLKSHKRRSEVSVGTACDQVVVARTSWWYQLSSVGGNGPETSWCWKVQTEQENESQKKVHEQCSSPLSMNGFI